MDEKKTIDDFFIDSEDNKIFTANGDYVFSFVLEFPPRFSLSKDAIEDMYTTWIRAFKCLPVDTFIVKSDVYKTLLFNEDMGCNSFIQRQNTQYFKDKSYLGHKSYLFVIFPSDVIRAKQMRNPFAIKNLQRKPTNIEKLETIVEEFKRTLASEKIKVRKANIEEIKQFSVGWWNGLQDDSINDIVCNENNISIGHKKAGIVAITNEKEFPETLDYITKDITFSKELEDFTFFKGLPDTLGLSLNFDHIYTQIIRIEDKKTVLDQIIHTQEHLNGLRKFSYLNASGAERLGQYLEDLKNRDQTTLGFTHCHTNVLFFADSDNQLKSRLEDVKEKMKVIALPYVPTGKRLQNLFYNTFFANVPCLDEDSLYLVTNDIAAMQIINNSNYNGDAVGVYFQDRIFQKPFKYDLWDENLQKGDSRGFLIFSPTGSGKSVLANAITTGLVDLRYPEYDTDGNIIGEAGIVTVIIDCGRSYEKMSLSYPKEEVTYFRYDAKANLGLNPFTLLGTELPNATQIENVCQVVWMIIRQGKEVEAVEQTSLIEIVKAYYIVMSDQNRLNEVSWFSFYSFVEEDGEELLKVLKIKKEYFDRDEFLHNGKNFTTGIYKNVFADNPELVKRFLKKRIIIFELEEIKENPLLLSIMILIINTVIYQVIWDKSIKGQALFDEFAQLLQKGDIFQSVAYMTQTIRKQNGLVGIVLQTPGQMPEGKDKKNIIGNTNTIFMLPTDKKNVIKEVVETCGLSDNEHAMIRSLKHKFEGERPYSEVFIHSRTPMVARVELPPKVLALYQTNADDTVMLMRILEKNDNNMELAIDKYLKFKQTIKNTEE